MTISPAPLRTAPGERSLAEYLLVVWRRRTAVMVGVVVAGLATFAVSALVPKVYEATGTVMLVDPKMSDQAPIRPGGDYKAVQEIVQQLLRNEANLGAVIAETPALHGMATGQLAEHLDTQTVAYSPVVVVSLEERSPEVARDVLDKLLTRAIALNQKMSSEELTGSRAFLKSDLDEAQRAMNAARDALRTYSERARLDERQQLVSSTLFHRADLVSSLAQARSDLNGATASRNALTEALKNSDSVVKLSRSVLDDPTAQQLARERGEPSQGVVVNTEELNPAVTEASRLLQRAISEQADARGRVETLSAEIAALDRRLPTLQAEYAAADAEHDRLQREYEVAADSYGDAVKRYDDARVVVTTRLPQVRILSPAVASPSPVSPRPLLNAMAAAVAALVLCVVGAIVADAFAFAGGAPTRPKADGAGA